MKIGLRSLYLDTLGGGERYFFSVAEFFLRRKDEVTIFWDKEPPLSKIKDRYGLDLSRVKFIPDIFSHPVSVFDKIVTTRDYDLLFFLSDGSVPSSLATKNILHFQVPFNSFNGKTLTNKLKLLRFQKIICNSKFTKEYIDETFGINSEVIYPPVDVENFIPGRKEKLILSVGRFFSPSHPKKQEILVDTFKKIYSQTPGWRLVLIGGVFPGSEDAVVSLKERARGFPIQILTDVDFPKLCGYYANATIYWHAAGFGENLQKYPDKAEHFGISTVEAMSAGAVPIVFAGGGQLEVVKENENGFLWTTPEDLAATTVKIVADKDRRNKLSQKAQETAQFFSQTRFFADWDKLLA